MSVRMKFFYTLIPSAYDHPSFLSEARKINELAVGEHHPFYLISGALSDLSQNRHGDLDRVLSNVERVEQGLQDSYEWEGQGFTLHMTRERVRFEHSIFGECPEWPIWCCTLAQYKAALEGYRRFLDMPKSIESELVIELPDGEPENC